MNFNKADIRVIIIAILVSSVVSFVALNSVLAINTNKVASLETKINDTNKKITNHLIEEIFSNRESASFTPSSEGFDIVDTIYGPLLLKIEDIKDYANGYEVSVGIGNIQAMTLSDIDMQVTWNRDRGAGISYSDWEKTQSIKQVNVLGDFPPNKWTYKKIKLTPAKKEDIQNMWIKLDLSKSTIRMR